MALVPDPAAADVQPGQLVRLDVPGLQGPPVAARTVKAEVADQAAIRSAGFPSSSEPAVLVTGTLAPDADVASLPSGPRQEAQAVVVLGSRKLLDLFLGQLQGTLGKGGDG